jgi:hypothetical protein
MQQELGAADITPTHGTVLQLVQKVEGLGQTLYMDNYFISSALFDNLYTTKINFCGTVCHNRKDMPPNIRPSILKLLAILAGPLMAGRS